MSSWNLYDNHDELNIPKNENSIHQQIRGDRWDMHIHHQIPTNTIIGWVGDSSTKLGNPPLRKKHVDKFNYKVSQI
jgi:hypothetical protein